jgi:AcrR family transcriptional regulator
MAGYRRSEMTQTPWGIADELRARMLRPGPGMPREEVTRSQRERLFAAMVACVERKGYEATTVADLLELSGVSRSAFYEHFHDKEDCLIATFEAIVAKALELIEHELGEGGTWEHRARATLDSLFEMIIHQPAAARLCFSEIYAAGARGRRAVDQAMVKFSTAAGETIGQIRGGDQLPMKMIRGVLGGAQMIIESRLRRDDVESLSNYVEPLWEWVLGYEAPSVPLRLAGRRPRPTDGPPPFVAYSQAERIIRALAASAGERGYPAVTIAEIAARASVSQATFYSYFLDKDAALVAALDSAGAQMLGVVMPAARRAPDWPSSIRAAIGALFAFCAAEPDLARLTMVEVYSAGPTALEQRDRTIDEIRGLLEPGLSTVPGAKQSVVDAAFGSVWTLLYDQVTNGGPENLPQSAPLASYMVLAPFIGSEQAIEVANGDGRGRPQ